MFNCIAPNERTAHANGHAGAPEVMLYARHPCRPGKLKAPLEAGARRSIMPDCRREVAVRGRAGPDDLTIWV